MSTFFSSIGQGVQDIMFPKVCAGCGQSADSSIELLCSDCAYLRYDSPNPTFSDACAGVILPEHVALQDALWRFDKRGTLQDLLHQLKYSNMGKLGIVLGKLLGSRLVQHPRFMEDTWQEALIVPVPLHPKRFKKRGYNQAERLAAGLSEVSHWKVINKDAVIRTRSTKTQTGFSLMRRQENIKEAFAVEKSFRIENKPLIIIDDVFTTGATTFELAKVLKQAGSGPLAVVSIALA